MSIEENRRILSDLHTAINNRDVDKAISLFADDASFIMMPGSKCSSKAEIRKYFEKMMKNYEKLVFRDIQPPVVSGDMATHEYMIDVKLRNGPEGTVPALVVAEFHSGRITEIRQYVDRLEAAKRLARGAAAKRAVAIVAKRAEALINP